MDCASTDNEPSEMEIVDTFTKLIFGVDQDFSVKELAIIQTLRQVDDNIALDSQREMGIYLRALGVAEMIKLVRRVRQAYPPQEQTPTHASLHQRARF